MRIRGRDCASSVRRVRKNHISCANSSKLTVFLTDPMDETAAALWLHRRGVLSSPVDSLTPPPCFFFLQRSLQQVRYLSSAPRTVECRPRVKGRSLSFPLRIYRLGWKKMTVLFLYVILVLRLPLSHPFVGRWHRRFTGSGGGAINSRRRCLSWCLVIYSDRFINFWWL